MTDNGIFSRDMDEIKSRLTGCSKALSKLRTTIELDGDNAAAINMALDDLIAKSERMTHCTRLLGDTLYRQEQIEAKSQGEYPGIPHAAIGYTPEGWLCVRLPLLLPKKYHGNVDYIRHILYTDMQKFIEANGRIKWTNRAVIIVRNVYCAERRNSILPDLDNMETHIVQDIISMFALPGDAPQHCTGNYFTHTFMHVRESCTEFFVVPPDDFALWLSSSEQWEPEFRLLPSPLAKG